MHVTLPAVDGQDLDCPHQFVGRCDACSAASAGQGVVNEAAGGASAVQENHAA